MVYVRKRSTVRWSFFYVCVLNGRQKSMILNWMKVKCMDCIVLLEQIDHLVGNIYEKMK